VLIERRRGEDERTRLHEQLRHADRLATIGQLAAGVAHELNEPLANVLGFAQLALKADEVPEQPRADLKNIEAAALHAREVIRKLMFFGRQMPQRTEQVSLNKLVNESMYFLESRCDDSSEEQ
jgi:C4-dicarboxylate-specific signal transduction histidine kinase